MLSLLFAYRIASSYGSSTGALLLTGFMASAAYPVLYSRLARPYAFGLLFILMFAFYWSKFLKARDRKEEFRWMPMFILSAALCTLTHYFCGLTAILLGIIGFFHLRKGAWWNYLISGLGVLLLFLPHLRITLRDLSFGGVGGKEGWLEAPGLSFFSEHLLRIFNDSPWVLLAVTCLLSIGILMGERDRSPSPPWALVLVFILPPLIGYFYSVQVNPVLQNSVLIFSMPFLFIVLFPRVGEIHNASVKSGVVLLLTLGLALHTYSSVWYYKTPTNGNFKEIARIYADQHDKYGADRIRKAASFNSGAYLDHYLQGRPRLSAPSLSQIEPEEDLGEFLEHIERSETPYFIYAWAATANRPIYREIVREEYPHALEHHAFFNSGITLYAREGEDERERLHSERERFDDPASSVFEKEESLNSSSHRSPPYSYRMEEETLYGPGFEKELKKVIEREGSILVKGTAWIKGKGPFDELRLVLSYGLEDSTYMWRSSPRELLSSEPEEGWQKIFAVGAIRREMPRAGTLKCYLWNKGRKAFLLDDMKLEMMPWWDLNSVPGFLEYRRKKKGKSSISDHP
ncbi:MAG: hypothetical protein ABEH38_04030 [Flavobacteriales bacterium]